MLSQICKQSLRFLISEAQTSDECQVHMLDTFLTPKLSRHYVRHVFAVSNFYFYFCFANTSPKNWTRSKHISKRTTDTSLDTQQTHLWFIPFARQHPLTFSNTPLSLIIFHSSLSHRHLVV